MASKIASRKYNPRNVGIPMKTFLRELNKQYKTFDWNTRKGIHKYLVSELNKTLQDPERTRMWDVLVEVDKKVTPIDRNSAIIIQLLSLKILEVFIEKESDIILDQAMLKKGWINLFKHYILLTNEDAIRSRHIQVYHSYKQKAYNEGIEEIKNSIKPRNNFNGIILAYTKICTKKRKRWND